MNTLMEPFSLNVDSLSGKIEPTTTSIRRTLSDLGAMYADQGAVESTLKSGDPLIYEVFQYDVPPENGQLVVCTTVIQPGRIGQEYFMTKGHFHEKREASEVYFGLRGRGILLLEHGDHLSDLEIGPGIAAYVPPYWAHRTVNTGAEPFCFLAVYPADAGHDYGTIERSGFKCRVLDEGGSPVVRAPQAAMMASP